MDALNRSNGANRPFQVIALQPRAGSEWLTTSLEGGLEISIGVLADSSLGVGRFLALVQSDASSEEIHFPALPDVPREVALAGLAWILEELKARGASCVVIEDDLAESGDAELSQIEIPSAFIGNRVVHWCDLATTSGSDAALVIAESAMGYPLNAFVLSKSSAELGLVDKHPVPDRFASTVVAGLMSVIGGAFDATSFAAWIPDATLGDQLIAARTAG